MSDAPFNKEHWIVKSTGLAMTGSTLHWLINHSSGLKRLHNSTILLFAMNGLFKFPGTILRILDDRQWGINDDPGDP